MELQSNIRKIVSLSIELCAIVFSWQEMDKEREGGA